MGARIYDVVVVGGGAAGLSAALVLGRARRRVAVIDAGAPRNAPAAHMQGFLSRDGMPPAELLAAGRAEVTGYGVELVEDQVRAIEPGFVVRLAGGRALTARRILVATGVSDELPDIPGVRERWGRDLLHCPYCHGWEVRDQPLGVLGTHPGSVQHAQLVRQWSDDVVFFVHTYDLTASRAAPTGGTRDPGRPRRGRATGGRGRPADRRRAGRRSGDRADRGVRPARQPPSRRRSAARPGLRGRRGRLRHRRCHRPDQHPRRVGRRQRRRSTRPGDHRGRRRAPPRRSPSTPTSSRTTSNAR